MSVRRRPPPTTEAVMERLLEEILTEGAFDRVLTEPEAEALLAASRGGEAEKRYALGALRTQALTCTPQLEAMTAEARLLLTVTPPERAHEAATLAANALICSGRYGEALRTEAWAEDRAGSTTPYDEGQPHLLQINLAEAEYNLGQWSAAKARLARLREDELWGDLLTHGLRAQRAWIAAHEGDRATLRAFLADFDPLALSPLYRAEQHFCAAVAHLALGDAQAALEHAALGQRTAQRASSHRNARFLLAAIHAHLNGGSHATQALQLWEEGAAHPYRGQGGDSLLAWGDHLHALGQEGQARHAWALAKERDPESAAARRASEQLQN